MDHTYQPNFEKYQLGSWGGWNYPFINEVLDYRNY